MRTISITEGGKHVVKTTLTSHMTSSSKHPVYWEQGQHICSTCKLCRSVVYFSCCPVS